MGIWNKIKKGLKVGTPIARVFVPQPIGLVLERVNDSLNDEKDVGNAEAIIAIGSAIVALNERLKKVEGK